MAERVLHQPLYPIAPDFFQLYTTSFIPLPNIDFTLTTHGQQIMDHVQHLKQLLSQGYYFTFDGDKTGIDRDKFMWNQYLYRELYQQQIQNWDLLLIQGFIHSFLIYLDGKRVHIALIARRSKLYPGTRQYDTGITTEGNVANFVESEQIVSTANLKCTYLQIRGSVPVFWKQKGMLIKNLELTASSDQNQKVLEQHFNNLAKKYERVLAVNLMNHNKSMEKELIKQYEQGVQQMNTNHVKYVYYNFDEQTQGYNFNIINQHVKQISNMIRNLQFNAYDMRNNKILLKQKGILRTNCMACLDRTNVYQHRVALFILELQLQSMGINFQSICGSSALDVVDDGDLSKCHPLVVSFRSMWADHGDFISKHYSGTGSMHSNQERQGQSSFMQILGSGLVPISRFYKTNFSEHIRQESIEILLGISKISKQLEEKENFEKKIVEATQLTTYYNFSEEDLKKCGYEKMEIVSQKQSGIEGQIICVKGKYKDRWVLIKVFREEYTSQFDEEINIANNLYQNIPNNVPQLTGTNQLKYFLIFDLGQSNLNQINKTKLDLQQEWGEIDLLHIMLEVCKILKQMVGLQLYVSDLRPRQVLFQVNQPDKLDIKLNVAEQIPTNANQFPTAVLTDFMDPLVIERLSAQATAIEKQESITNTADLLNEQILVNAHEAEQAAVWMLGRVVYTSLFPESPTNTNDIHIMIPQLEQMIESKKFAVLCKLLKRVFRGNVVENIVNFDILEQEILKAQRALKIQFNPRYLLILYNILSNIIKLITNK